MNKTKLGSIIRKSAFNAPVQDVFWPIPDQYIGVEIELEGQSRGEMQRHQEKGSPFWTEHQDGSLRGGIEYVLDQPMMGSGLRDAIDYFYDNFTKFTTSPRTSIHVHVNMRQDGESVEGLRNMVVLYYMYEDAFFKVADENRKWCSYANSFEDTPPRILEAFMTEGKNAAWFERELLNSAAVNQNRYYGLNLNALIKFGTLEFRHFPLVHEKERLVEWIKLIMELKKAANTMADEGLSVWEVFARPEDLGKLDHYMPLYANVLQGHVDTSRAFIRMTNVRVLAEARVQNNGGIKSNAAFVRFSEAQEKLGKKAKVPTSRKGKTARGLVPPDPIQEILDREAERIQEMRERNRRFGELEGRLQINPAQINTAPRPANARGWRAATLEPQPAVDVARELAPMPQMRRPQMDAERFTWETVIAGAATPRTAGPPIPQALRGIHPIGVWQDEGRDDPFDAPLPENQF